MRHIISILVENEAGALSRISNMFSARGYNIESLTVAPTEDASMSRMTIVTAGSDDVVEQTWDLKRFAANPVAFFNHRSWGLPVGRWERVRVEGGVLRGDFVPTDASEEGRTIRAMLDEKTLRAASVGFVPGKVTERSKYPTDHPLYATRGYVFSENNLLECSIVGVPMHPDATLQERTADPAPAPAPVAEAKSAAPPDDGPDFDLDALERAVRGLFPVTTS